MVAEVSTGLTEDERSRVRKEGYDEGWRDGCDYTLAKFEEVRLAQLADGERRVAAIEEGAERSSHKFDRELEALSRDMVSAHNEGLHNETPRRTCPLCR
jgi:hypothetical protein